MSNITFLTRTYVVFVGEKNWLRQSPAFGEIDSKRKPCFIRIIQIKLKHGAKIAVIQHEICKTF